MADFFSSPLLCVKSLLALSVLAPLLASCGNGEAIGTGVGQLIDGVITSRTGIGRNFSDLRIAEMIGRNVGQSLDEVDRRKLQDATLKAAQTGQEQSFKSEKGETVIVQKAGPEIVATEQGPPQSCQNVERQIIRHDGSVQKDIAKVCDNTA